MDNWVWWKHGVIYQIYPRSFYDSTGDGIGDINGIIEKLDYLSELGVDGVWLSPINKSPMYDFGYDISDYRDIDPAFGTPTDYERLLEEAHKRGIKILMDLVMNYTSHLHPWFTESRSSRDNPKRDWYIWHDGKNGRPPNNWKGIFGGRAWERDEKTGQFYMHSFLKEMPDVNWRNKELKNAMFDMIRYWLDKGVDGFRLDVVNLYIKDDEFRNNPFTIGPTPRPYDMQKHIYDKNRPEIHDILREFRKILDSYSDKMSVGEIFVEPVDPRISQGYLGDGEDELHLAFDFGLIITKSSARLLKWGAKRFLDVIEKRNSFIPEKGWPCNVLSNHDNPRSISRFKGGKEAIKRAKVISTMLLTLRGTPFIYYGEEIGMRDGKMKHKDIMDPMGKKYWPLYTGRDPERTPMQWSPDENAGFTTGRPWLPVNNDFHLVNVETESQDPDSLLNLNKRLISLRKEKDAMNRGEWYSAKDASDDVMAYYRVKEDQKILVVLNFSNSPRPLKIDDQGVWKNIFSTHKPVGDTFKNIDFTLSPYEATILEQEGSGLQT
ncbi:MAG: alpha-glucosidase [Thermodesulfobacteriota bacterium]|nr:alpha-glucosidase [Thermodesulfobacteriota bacterium]